MILTTTSNIENHTIHEYLGIVSGVSSNLKTSFSFKTDKNLNMISELIDKAKEEAFEKLKENAEKLNANAIIGISVDLETEAGTYFFACIISTALKSSYNANKRNNN